MKTIFYIDFFLLLMLTVDSQNIKQHDQFIGIEGVLTGIRQAQDDISFYTWSLYLSIDLTTNWSLITDSAEVTPKIKELVLYCDNFSTTKLQVCKNCFHNKKEITQFLGKVKKGNKVKVFVSKSALQEYLKAEKCQVKMESIIKL